MIETEDGKTKSAAKGVSRHVKEKILSFTDFERSLFEDKVYKHQQVRIGQKNHEIFTMETNKVSIIQHSSNYLFFFIF